MSKASQRRKSAYDLGRQDARNNLYMRWIRHPYLKEYKAGYQSVLQARKRNNRAPLWESVHAPFLAVLLALREWNSRRRQRRFNKRHGLPPDY